jgi:3D (Asp-Asp-Asp) domain-containing protein/peptidoglycan hydrolase CwlO-like protein
LRLAALCALALAALLSSSTALADDPASLRSEAERLRAENDGLAARSQAALLELYSLETRLARAEARVTELRARRDALARAERSARRALDLARGDVSEAERRLGNRLRELYVQGEVDPLAVILAAESLNDALTAFDDLTRVADLDGSILAEIRDAKARLQRSVRELAEKSADLRSVVAAAEAEQAGLAAARAERESFLASLAAQRALNSRQISDLSARAAAAASRVPDDTPEPTASPEPAPEPNTPGPRPPGGQPMVVDVVAYCGGVGTASGLPLGWGTVAVDTRVFPFGTKMYIPGYGDGVAADRGTAIIGRIIDIWFPTCAQARAWGRKTLTITVYW